MVLVVFTIDHRLSDCIVITLLYARTKLLCGISYVTHPPEMSHVATFGVQPLSQRGCQVSILAFQRNQFLQSFFYIRKMHLLHTQKVYKWH